MNGWILGLVSIVSAIIGGLLTGYFSWLATKQAHSYNLDLQKQNRRAQGQHDFVARQLRDFYSPLLALRMEVQKRGELRVRIYRAADQAWRNLCAEPREPEALRQLTDDRRPEFTNIIEYDNRKLVEEVLPAYRRMVGIFREFGCLAEPETRAHFETLLEFVDLWDRGLANSLPREVIEALNCPESDLI